MPHTASRYQQDLGFTDGRLLLGPGDLVFTGTAPTLTRVPPGYNYVFPNTSTSFIGANISTALLRRTGFTEDLQEQFGGAGIAGSAQTRLYRGDQLGGMGTGQQLLPRTLLKTKGFRVTSFDVIYLVAGAALTTHTVRVDTVVYANNLAPANTVILASGVNGLQTPTQAQPYVTNVVIANPVYFTPADGSYWIELSIVTPGGGTYTLFGIDVVLEFNNN